MLTRSLLITLAFAWPLACDVEPDDGVFGASAGSPSTPGTSGAAASGGAEDPDTDGASGGERADTGGASADKDTAAPEATGDAPPPPPADEGGGTFNPLDDDGGEPTGTTSGGGGNPPPPPAGTCCTTSPTPGCSDAAIQACVCGADPFCCDTEWDAMCVSGADACGAGCGGGAAACCMPQVSPGCGDAAIESCVCLFDSYCCDVEWDDVCALSAQLDCGAAC